MAETRNSTAIIARAHYSCERSGGRLVWDEHEIRVETRRWFLWSERSRFYFTYSDYNEGEFLNPKKPKVTLFMLNQAIEDVPVPQDHLAWMCEAFRGNRFHPFYGQIDLAPLPIDRIRWVYLKHFISDSARNGPSHVESFEFEPQWDGARCKGMGKPEPLKRADLEHWDRVLHSRGEYSSPVYCALKRVFQPTLFETGPHERAEQTL